YDTCGQEIFYQITKATSEGSQGLLFIVDSTLELKSHSKEIVDVFTQVESHFGGDMPPTVIVCNKQDLVQKFRIEEGGFGKEVFMKTIMRSYEQKFAKIPFIDACAKDGWGVDKAVELLVEEICKDFIFMKDSKIQPRGFSKITLDKTIKKEKFSYIFEDGAVNGFQKIE
ncbi:MAG: GTPase domain-containing protein, partial [Candidatus Helarchaeota archaeon]